MVGFLEKALGRSAEMRLKSEGEELVFVNRVSGNVVIALLSMVLLGLGVGMVLSLLFGMPNALSHRLGFIVVVVLISAFAGASYKRQYVFDRGGQELRLSRRLLFFTATKKISYEAIESVRVCSSRRLLPGVMWPARVENHQLWIRLRTGRTVYLDMASDRQLIFDRQKLLQRALGQEATG